LFAGKPLHCRCIAVAFAFSRIFRIFAAPRTTARDILLLPMLPAMHAKYREKRSGLDPA
jgi:hypothetical protein